MTPAVSPAPGCSSQSRCSRFSSLPGAPSPLGLCLRRALVTALATLLLSVVFSWPLPKYAGRGIVHMAYDGGDGPPVEMAPGDHLQLLYHLWLAQDTFTGHTPLFRNLYEFNTGDDEERRDVTPYYLPFSAFFAAASIPFGRAAGWNFAGWMSLWLTGLFAWALARRYAGSETEAGLLALVPLAFPYVWTNLFGGSPTGFALMWVPILLYGLDRWTGDGSAAGAAWAGAAVFFSEWADSHVFFFGVLVSPFWVLFAWQHRNGWRWPRREEWRRLAASAWPLLLFAALAAMKVWAVSRDLQGTAAAGGRSRQEVANCSVGFEGMWRTDWSAKTYVGWSALAVFAALAALAAWRLRPGGARGAERRSAVSLVLLLGGLAGIAVLATGTRNPLGGPGWEVLTRVIPPYRMIRQADKIFCLVPTLAMMAVALGAAAVPPAGSARARRWRRIAALAVALAVALVWQARFRVGVCLLDTEQGAYAAVAADAAARGKDARAVALPLWPGDSHLSSLYQYGASLYRIRMLNGYRPTVRKKYREEIFDPLESVNLGNPSAAQLERLASCGVEYVLFHEDAFPAPVSPLAPGATLLNLLAHPRLQFLGRDKTVWAFRILPEGEPKAAAYPRGVPLARLPLVIPSVAWNWKNSLPRDLPATERLNLVSGDSANSDCWLHVAGEMEQSLASRWLRVTGPYEWQWRFRARGKGELEWTTREASGAAATRTVAFDAPEWTWLAVPAEIPGFPREPGGEWEITADFRLLSGEADMDAVLLTAVPDVPFPTRAPGEIAEVPAIAFFRPGFSEPVAGTVTFLPENSPGAEIFEARNLWLEPGPNRIGLEFESPAPEGTVLGALTLRIGNGPNAAETSCEVVAGRPAVLEMDVPDNRFFRLAYRCNRAAPITIRSVRFERMEGKGGSRGNANPHTGEDVQ